MKRTFDLALLTCVFLLSLSLASVDAKPGVTKRRLIHMFTKPGFATITVSIVDYPSGPKGFVMAVSNTGAKSQRAFAVSRPQFNKMWATFISSGADKYASAQDSQWLDGADYYFLVAGNQYYTVPKKGASQALVSVATQLRAYAK